MSEKKIVTAVKKRLPMTKNMRAAMYHNPRAVSSQYKCATCGRNAGVGLHKNCEADKLGRLFVFDLWEA